ncbi:DUF433 domain-containing protein [Corynebacterium callunae]|uniref:DUF433 domain-containing protein n=1 Tax=Corynebacterium callunae TaxID=1721 RepID=UPI001FFE96C3|nr:DUF433 domain-containing protein [Corynebacterium callunae]MCK2200497.1 DUF433 domain-containing protein [Corynebacterium callunae]
MPREYVEKHAYVQAMQLENTVESARAVADWCRGAPLEGTPRVSVLFSTDERGTQAVLTPGCWMIKRDGKFMGCGPDVFESQFEESFRLPSWVYDHPDVWTSPHRMGGQPCVRGTRIPVGILLNWITDCPEDDIREYYPSISADVIDRLSTAVKLAEEQK